MVRREGGGDASAVPASPAPDPLALYAASVQDAAAQVRVLERLYALLGPGRRARVLREDFAGAASESMAWVGRGPRRVAIAVERDPTTLAWAERRATESLTPRTAARLHFVPGDVLQVRPPRALPRPDLICALNFSILYLHERRDLLRYFRRARRALAPGGLLVLNVFGGPDSIRPHREVYPIESTDPRLPAKFDYHWEVVSFDATQVRGDYRIHFSWPTPGGRGRQVLRNAFRYDWRLWSPPELTGALRDAGFSQAIVWRHVQDPESGRIFFGPIEEMPHRPSWTVYVLGVA